MRPIDADALIEKCGDWYVDECTESGFIGTLENLLSTMPTIQPQSTTGQLNDGARSTARSTDLIDRRAAIDAAKDWYEGLICGSVNGLIKKLKALPTVPPEPSIPLPWIWKYIKWLQSLGNVLTDQAGAHILAMVHKWGDEQNETD